MAIGDKVKVGMGTIDTHPTSIPVYNVSTDTSGNIVFDSYGATQPVVVGTVKGGSTGTLKGDAVKVPKNLLRSYGDGAAAMAMEHVLMYPVEFDYYKRVGWIPQDHLHLI